MQTNLFDQSQLPVVSSFTIGRTEMIRAMRNVKRTVQINYRDSYFAKCLLFCLDGKVILHFFGNEVELPAEPVGFCCAEFYLKDALSVLIADGSKIVTVNIKRKTIGFNAVNLTVELKNIDGKGKEVPLSMLNENIKPTDPYEPSTLKNFYTRDRTRGFYFYEVHQDIEIINGILSKYKIESKEVEKFVYLFLRKDL